MSAKPYGVVPRSLWERPDLSTDARIALAFVRTHPSGGSLAGIFRTDLLQDLRELLGFSKKRATDALQLLRDRGELAISGRWVLVVNSLDTAPGFSISNPNHCKAISAALAEAPDEIRAAFLRRYPDAHRDAHPHDDRHAHRDQGEGTGEGTVEGTGREGTETAPRPPSRPSADVHGDDTERHRLAEELSRKVRAFVESILAEKPDCKLTDETVMQMASRILPSNGHAEKSFTDPDGNGIEAPWLRTTLQKLPEVQASIHQWLNPPL